MTVLSFHAHYKLFNSSIRMNSKLNALHPHRKTCCSSGTKRHIPNTYKVSTRYKGRKWLKSVRKALVIRYRNKQQCRQEKSCNCSIYDHFFTRASKGTFHFATLVRPDDDGEKVLSDNNSTITALASIRWISNTYVLYFFCCVVLCVLLASSCSAGHRPADDEQQSRTITLQLGSFRN